jgi:CzcA family heavy metal efflux pump
MNVGGWVGRHGRGVALLMSLAVMAGALAYVELPRGLYPELSFPRIAVVATLPDATSEIVLRNVTRPLEEALMPVLGVRRVRSKTIRGATELSVLFTPESDMVVALQLVQARLAEVRSELPADTSVVAERITPTSFPVYTINVEGNVPPTMLRDLALYQVRPALSRVPGVGPITVTAGFEREVEVIVDPARAEAAGLTLEEIGNRLSQANKYVTVGRLDRAYRRYAIVLRGNAMSAAQLGDFVVGGTDRAPVRLADVARIEEGSVDPRQVVRSPKGPAASVNVARRIGGDVTALDAGLEQELTRLRKEMPPGVTLTPVYQQAPLIHDATGAVRDAILVGSLLSALVIFLFLRDPRATLLAAVTIPASLLCACAVLLVFHGSLNLMSLGGMAIAVGLVIDDAVVVVEAIHRELAAGRTPREAAELGVSRLAGPVLSSTITTVVVFAPLAFISGVVGTFFAALSLALAAAVVASLVLALTVVPLVAARLGSTTTEAREERLADRYAGWLARALKRPALVVGIAALVVGASLAAGRWVESDFLPELDEGAYVFDYFAPIGTSLAEADALASQIDEILRNDPDVATFTRRLGAELGPPRATETSRGDIIVRLKRHHRPIEEIMEDQRNLVGAQLPGVRIELIQLLQDMLGDLEGNPEPIELKLFGSDEAELRRQAKIVADKIKDLPGIVDLFDGQVACSPERIVRVDPVAAGRAGLTTDAVSNQMSAALLGADSTPIPEQDRLVPVRVRWPDAARFDEHALERVRIKTPAGAFIPLAEVAKIADGCAPSEINRENLRLMVPVTARLEGRDLGSAIADVEKQLATVKLPAGYAIEIGGQRLSQQESFRSLGMAIAAALALVLVVLVFQFGSFGASAAILTALPLALAGGLAALVATRTPLNVSSLLGGILLVGLVVKNGILLLHRARERENAGEPVADALVDAARLRLRPILMTTLCTLFGLVPLALGLGTGAEMHRPLAVAVLGGLSLSTVGTLFVVPALYALFRGLRRR